MSSWSAEAKLLVPLPQREGYSSRSESSSEVAIQNLEPDYSLHRGVIDPNQW